MIKEKRSPRVCYFIGPDGNRARRKHRGKYRSCPYILASYCQNKSCELAGISLLNPKK